MCFLMISITDSIRMIGVADEHIPKLVEMLAERISGVLLSHPRVTSAWLSAWKGFEVRPGRRRR